MLAWDRMLSGTDTLGNEHCFTLGSPPLNMHNVTAWFEHDALVKPYRRGFAHLKYGCDSSLSDRQLDSASGKVRVWCLGLGFRVVGFRRSQWRTEPQVA